MHLLFTHITMTQHSQIYLKSKVNDAENKLSAPPLHPVTVPALHPLPQAPQPFPALYQNHL